tara:strand:+ start:225 stop:476 length:252 start_codon:yes stop_codon:yes gene_type:complete
MDKEALRELIRSIIQEYMGTGSSGGNATDGNDITSQRPFDSEGNELNFYTDKGAPYGGAEGQQTRGMEKSAMGNPNRTRFTRF